jgi:hemoglobin
MNDRPETFRGCDLDNRDEIFIMVTRFYGKVAQDNLLGPVFNDVARVDWSDHIDRIADFWDAILLGHPGYSGNPLEAHQRINALTPFTHEQFRRWLELFQETVDAGWTGERAQEIKRKAVKIAVNHSRILTGTPLDVLLQIKDGDVN